jgi:hypothetical protein
MVCNPLVQARAAKCSAGCPCYSKHLLVQRSVTCNKGPVRHLVHLLRLSVTSRALVVHPSNKNVIANRQAGNNPLSPLTLTAYNQKVTCKFESTFYRLGYKTDPILVPGLEDTL